MMKQEHPYVAMVNQRFHRTYIDCAEFGAESGTCCINCLGEKKTMLDAPAQKKIYKAPPTVDGSNTDWAMNIEAVVCCNHVHLVTNLTREEWLKLVAKYKATPFFENQRDTRYSFDDTGRIISERTFSLSKPIQHIQSNQRVGKRGSKEETGGPPRKMIKCQFCSTQHPIFGKCPKCFPDLMEAK